MVDATNIIPKIIPNWINGQESCAEQRKTITKLNPATGEVIAKLTGSQVIDVQKAITSAKQAQREWADTPAVARGAMLRAIAQRLEAREQDMAAVVALETGKSFNEALGETRGAIQQAYFMAGEGMRLYGRTTTSGVFGKQAMTVRHPMGIAGLIVAANTPIANIAWKVFPALICGNAAILKAPEDTPATAWLFGQIVYEVGLPKGVLNIIQGLGQEAGAPLVSAPEVSVVSFTGSTKVGREIARVAGERLAKVSLELGGKNALVVCDDADLDKAVKWAVLSAFSNAGQRCAAAGRVIVFASVYDVFKEKFIAAAEKLSVGSSNDDDYGPVINERQLQSILNSMREAQSEGAVILTGGARLEGNSHRNGYFVEPTIIENVSPQATISNKELFGPVACLYKVADFNEAVALANDSEYGLTACIHTTNVDRALEFTRLVDSGVVVVNAGTYGSEPHMPFGGVKQSGNGSREPGTEALDVYSNLKDVYLNGDIAKV